METYLGRWLQQVRAAWRRSTARWPDGIVVNGNAQHGVRRLGATVAYLLSACRQRSGLVLEEVAVPDTTNELGVVGALLERLPPGCETVTFDAAFAQWTVARQHYADHPATLFRRLDLATRRL